MQYKVVKIFKKFIFFIFSYTENQATSLITIAIARIWEKLRCNYFFCIWYKKNRLIAETDSFLLKILFKILFFDCFNGFRTSVLHV